RDRFYDPSMNNLNWDEIRRKYVDAAAASVDERQLATVISLMLGELNASHMGFTPTRTMSSSEEESFNGLLADIHVDDMNVDPLSLWESSPGRDDDPE